MTIKTLWKMVGEILLIGGCASVALLLAQDAPPAAAGRGGRAAPPQAWAPKPITPTVCCALAFVISGSLIGDNWRT